MITRATRIQLLVFVVITLLGVSYVGAKYAELDRYFVDETYTVVAHFEESGGIFPDAEVTYRGVGIGSVAKLELTDSGVDVYLTIEDDHDEIPAETRALVGTRSAVGEQYVELQPQTDSGPYLRQGSEIGLAATATPISTTKLLTDISRTVTSVDRDALRTTVDELGKAFTGTGKDLQQIIDTGNAFIETANANIDLTTALIGDANTVLRGQLASESAIRSFARDLALFSDTLAASDEDLRKVIARGSATANQLRTFLEQYGVDLGELLNRLVITGEVIVSNLDGVEQLLVIYPYVVEGGYTVVQEDPQSGLNNAHFGLVLTMDPPLCHEGYESTNTRPPQQREDLPLNTDARCTAPATKTNPRGAQHAPGADSPRAPTAYRAPVVASYEGAGELTWRSSARDLAGTLGRPGRLAPRTSDKESWTWLYLQPRRASRE